MGSGQKKLVVGCAGSSWSVLFLRRRAFLAPEKSMSDHGKIILAAAGSFGVSLAQVNGLVQISVGLAALGFSLWKWRQAVLKNRNRK